MTSFQQLTLHFETANNVPPPYSYRYKFTLKPTPQTLLADIAIVYTDRDEVQADEIEAEGFTENDDFSWKGSLETVWQKEIEKMLLNSKITNTKVGDESDLLVLEYDNEKGVPSSLQKWLFLAQELVQATYETAKKERPFELLILKKDKDQQTEAKLTASFVNRTIVVEGLQTPKTIDWRELSGMMETIFAPDYVEKEASEEKPTKNGLYISMGDGLWYEVGKQIVEPGRKSQLVPKLVALLDKIMAS
jgi:hypothetical protein